MNNKCFKNTTFTLETRLNKQNSKELIDYFKLLVPYYAKIYRFVWQDVKRKTISILIRNKSKYNTFLQNKFSISKRTASSIINDILGKYNALLALKKYEIKQIEGKSKKIIKQINILKEKINKTKLLIANNKATLFQLKNYKKNKNNLYKKQQKINYLKIKTINIQKQIDTGKFSICFGTKKLFKAQHFLKENNFKTHEKWLNVFRKNRDKNIYYWGSSTETACNSEFQLKNLFNDCYQIKVRTIDCLSNTKSIYGQCRFKYKFLEEYLKENLLLNKNKDKCVALSYRIVFRDKKIYLQCVFVFDKNIFNNKNDIFTTKTFGTVGLDYNKGFIQLAETNSIGNLINLKKFDLKYHGTGNKAKSEIREQVAKIIKYCKSKNKSLIIENLDFIKTKSQIIKAKSNKGKKRNKMIHDFDYSRYKQCIGNACVRNNIELILVNPAYTSKIARQKYCKQRSLGVHQGASYVITRRGQGFKDCYNKNII